MNIPPSLPRPHRPAYSGPGSADGPTDGPGAADRPGAQHAGTAPDSVEVSEGARLVARLHGQVDQSPEEREALIAQIRGAIDAGTYTINARLLAERLLPGLEA